MMADQEHPIRVVLADDHALVRAGIRQFLVETKAIQVVAEAGDGEAAIAMIREYAPDVAVLDIQMPKATGIDVTRTVRANRWPVGVLVLTAYDDYPYIHAVLKCGANGYILKTATPDEITAAVQDVYQGKSVLDAAILPKLIAKAMCESEEQLSDREIEVLQLVAKGLTNKVIAHQLNISDRTVQGHVARIFTKLQTSSRTEAVMKGIALDLIQPVDKSLET